MTFALPRQAGQRRDRGFSLVEMLIAMSLGLILIVSLISVYLSSKNAFRRTEELSALQNSARTAFEYLSFDAKMAGMLGCQAGESFLAPGITPNFLSDYAVPLEGYEASGAPSFSLTGVQAANQWANNRNGAEGSLQIAFNTTGSGLPNAISAGSDVLVLRGPASAIPLRLRDNAAAGATTLTIENTTVTGSGCQTTSTAASGLCAGSHVLVSSCKESKVVGVRTLALASGNVSLTLEGTGLSGAGQFTVSGTEVFPMQTIVYYVAPSVNNPNTHSLYRHVFNGTNNTGNSAGERQELIEGVENMQLRYGEDESADATRDYTADVYRNANEVVRWSKVMSVRISLLVRPPSAMAADVAGAASASMDGVTVTYPDTRFDRRVFTSTVALRNRIPYTAP